MNVRGVTSTGIFPAKETEINKLTGLEYRLLQFSFFNLFLTACVGVLLRTFPLLDSFPLVYKNVLHGHSHFAFGGWIMPVLFALILKYFTELRNAVPYKHWRNIAVMMLVSAYGMLIAFPIQGYKAVSIAFSTLSLASGIYLALVVWKWSNRVGLSLPLRFLRAATLYHVVSATGPFATIPLIMQGKAGSPLYFDVIYFFLHFQYNGFFTFTIFAIVYKMLQAQNRDFKNARLVYSLMHLACVPAYFLSVLWHNPPVIFNIIGGLAATLQLIAVVFFIKDSNKIIWKHSLNRGLFYIMQTAFALKIFLQLLSAFPVVANTASIHRNLVIAYLHLVLLGFISMFSFIAVFEGLFLPGLKKLRIALALFLTGFFSTELLLVISVAGYGSFRILNFSELILLCSCFFPVGLLLLFLNIRKQIANTSRVSKIY